MPQRRFVMLDRDGTIIAERDYLADPAGVELLPGALAGLRRLQGAGFGLVVLTNQSGVARGYVSEARLAEIHARMRDLLAAGDVALDGVYHCPHAPEANCACRKPATGLALAAAAEHGFDPAFGAQADLHRHDVAFGRRTNFLVQTMQFQRGDHRVELRIAEHAADFYAVRADLFRFFSGEFFDAII